MTRHKHSRIDRMTESAYDIPPDAVATAKAAGFTALSSDYDNWVAFTIVNPSGSETLANVPTEPDNSTAFQRPEAC